MSKRLRPSATLALVALISLTSAGCSSKAPSETGTAGSGAVSSSSSAASSSDAVSSSDAASSGAGGEKNATDQDKLVKFAECIRGHGVPNFPDANAKGEFVFGIDVSPAVWKKAVDACKDLQPPGALSSKRNPEQQKAALKFAECMRANGVKDFPDPVDGEPLVDTYRIPSSNRSGGMSILNAAMQKCRALVAAAAGSQP